MALKHNRWDKIIAALESESDTESNAQKEERLIEQHLSDITDTKRRLSTDNTNHQWIQSIIDLKSANHVCNRALHDLKPISISRLKPNTIHYGFQLMCKIITEADKLLSFRTIVKDIDSNGNHSDSDVMELSIYNLIPFNISLTQLEKKKILCKNTIICIKEPYCKFYKSKKFGLRIDNPYYNLCIINNTTQTNNSSSIDTLRLVGNSYFKQNKYWNAIKCYTDALQLDSDTNEHTKLKLLLNRCLSYLKLDEHKLAYIDAHNAFKIDCKCLKVQYRYLCALTIVGKHREAVSMVNNVMNNNMIHSNSIRNEFMNLQRKIKRRYHESIGKYNDISYGLMSDDIEWQNVEDYIGNINIVQINKTKGRGIVAIKDIQKGELILVEKAFSFGCYEKRDQDQHTFIQTFDEQCSTAYSGRNQDLILNTISKCFCYNFEDYTNCSENINSSGDSMQCVLNKWKLLQLFDGDTDRIQCVDKNIIEIFRNYIEIMDDVTMCKMKNEVISAKKVNDIILSNAFETIIKPYDLKYFLDDNSATNKGNFDVIKNERYCGCGLWIIASLFNHSNDANAQRCVYYKTMFIKSKRSIRKGEEITISYIDQSISSKHRKQEQLKKWGI